MGYEGSTTGWFELTASSQVHPYTKLRINKWLSNVIVCHSDLIGRYDELYPLFAWQTNKNVFNNKMLYGQYHNFVVKLSSTLRHFFNTFRFQFHSGHAFAIAICYAYIRCIIVWQTLECPKLLFSWMNFEFWFLVALWCFNWNTVCQILHTQARSYEMQKLHDPTISNRDIKYKWLTTNDRKKKKLYVNAKPNDV